MLYDDVSTITFTRKRAFFPLTPDSWIRPLGDEFGDLHLDPKKTVEVLKDPAFWFSLEVFHRTICEGEFVNKKLANVDEFVRLKEKAQHRDAAEAAGYDAIGAVLRSGSDTLRELLDSVGSEPVVKACALVGLALGIEVRAHPGATGDLPYEETVAAVSSASGFRTRLVALRDDWWQFDHGPLLGQIQATRDPVALLPIERPHLRVRRTRRPVSADRSPPRSPNGSPLSATRSTGRSPKGRSRSGTSSGSAPGGSRRTSGGWS